MILEFNTSLNFGAKLIKRSPIKTFSPNKELGYEPLLSSIVEIDLNRQKDKDAVAFAVSGWGEGDSYGNSIAEDINNGETLKRNGKVYAITLQDSDFAKLDGGLIVGLSEVVHESKNNLTIKFLQASPIRNKTDNSKKYVNVGKSFIEMFKKNPLNHKIIVQASYTAANFYEKMKFKIIDTDKLIYVWEKDPNLVKFLKSALNKKHYKKMLQHV